MSCSFGYELDPRKLSEEEREEVRKNNQYYRQIEPLVLHGDFYRLLSLGLAPGVDRLFDFGSFHPDIALVEQPTVIEYNLFSHLITFFDL